MKPDTETADIYLETLLSHYIVKRYPGYLEDFKALERMAPEEDLYAQYHAGFLLTG